MDVVGCDSAGTASLSTSTLHHIYPYIRAVHTLFVSSLILFCFVFLMHLRQGLHRRRAPLHVLLYILAVRHMRHCCGNANGTQRPSLLEGRAGHRSIKQASLPLKRGMLVFAHSRKMPVQVPSLFRAVKRPAMVCM